MAQSKIILIPDDDDQPIITQPKRTTFYIINNGKVVKRPNVIRYKHLTTQFGSNKGYCNMLINIRGSYNTGEHLIIIEWDTIKIIKDDEVVYRCHARTKEKFLSFQQRYWFHIGIPFVYYMNRITDEDRVFFFYPPVGERTEWDITISEEESIKEYCITSGEWTDLIYNDDGTFSHTPTKEEDIPRLEICG